MRKKVVETKHTKETDMTSVESSAHIQEIESASKQLKLETTKLQKATKTKLGIYVSTFVFWFASCTKTTIVYFLCGWISFHFMASHCPDVEDWCHNPSSFSLWKNVLGAGMPKLLQVEAIRCLSRIL